MHSKQKVVLVYPRPTELDAEATPLSLFALARMLDRDKYEVKIINEATESDFEQKAIEYSKGALCFGISSMIGPQLHGALNIARLIKEEYPTLPIIWGGYHPTLLSRETIQHPCVDIVVRGQGERTFQEIVHHLSNGLSLDDVKGIVYKKNKIIIENEDRPFEDINNFPPMPYNLIKEEYIIHYKYSNRCIPYLSSQGCPLNCGFCCEPTFCGRRWRGLKADRVVDDLVYLVNRYNVDTFLIRDSNFFVDKKRIKDICEGILREKLDINLVNLNGWVGQLLCWEDEMWKLMRRAGLREILVGAESGYLSALELIDKGITVDDTVAFIKKCVKYDISARLSLMIGLPTLDTDKEIVETIELIDQIYRYYNETCANVEANVDFLLFSFTPYPGSRLYDVSIDCGFRPYANLEDWANHGLSDFEAPWVSKRNIRLVRQLSLTILPYITYNIDFSSKNLYKKIFAKTVRKTAQFRWKHKFFDLPIEFLIASKGKKLYLWR